MEGPELRKRSSVSELPQVLLINTGVPVAPRTEGAEAGCPSLPAELAGVSPRRGCGLRAPFLHDHKSCPQSSLTSNTDGALGTLEENKSSILSFAGEVNNQVSASCQVFNQPAVFN